MTRRSLSHVVTWPRILVAAIAALLVLVPGAPATSHPHAWIDLRSGLLFDERGRITAIEQEWFFDYFYSTIIAEELAMEDRPIQDVLDELARINLNSLADYDFFTEMIADGGDVAIGSILEYETAMRGERLWLRFVVELEKPVDPNAQIVSYSIYDPSYYIEMVHLEGEPVMLRGGETGSCIALTQSADPTFEAIALAAAIDRTQTGPADLGAMFAEWVHVTCD